MSERTFKLSKEDYGSLVEIIYGSPDAQSHHNTSGLDKFSKDDLKGKLREMIVCNEHKSCKILTQLFKDEEESSPFIPLICPECNTTQPNWKANYCFNCGYQYIEVKKESNFDSTDTATQEVSDMGNYVHKGGEKE